MNCETCKFFVSGNVEGHTHGKCHRMPRVAVTDADHWCGEYVAAEKVKGVVVSEYEYKALERDANYWRKFSKENSWLASAYAQRYAKDTEAKQ